MGSVPSMAKRRTRTQAEREVDRLYGLPLEDFTKARDDLARRLRSDGDREAAADVRALRKPTAAAWAVNQGVRANERAAKRVVRAGGKLAGASGRSLREAMAEEGKAVEAMVAAVEGAAGAGTLSRASLDRVRETIRAVASDDELRAQFEAGRVLRDHRAVGFGSVDSLPAAPAVERRSAKRPDGGRARRARAAVKRARDDLDAAAKTVAMERKRLERARQALGKAQSAVDAAEERRREAEGKLRDAERQLED
jgi:hypothetical protein